MSSLYVLSYLPLFNENRISTLDQLLICFFHYLSVNPRMLQKKRFHVNSKIHRLWLRTLFHLVPWASVMVKTICCVRSTSAECRLSWHSRNALYPGKLHQSYCHADLPFLPYVRSDLKALIRIDGWSGWAQLTWRAGCGQSARRFDSPIA